MFFDFVHSWIYINQYWVQYKKSDDLPAVTYTERVTAPEFAADIFNFLFWELGDAVDLGAQNLMHFVC